MGLRDVELLSLVDLESGGTRARGWSRRRSLRRWALRGPRGVLGTAVGSRAAIWRVLLLEARAESRLASRGLVPLPASWGIHPRRVLSTEHFLFDVFTGHKICLRTLT